MLTTFATAEAQSRKSPARGSESCVDVATLRQGKAVRGLLVAGDGNNNSPWLMAVERQAMEKEHPPLFKLAAKTELQKTTQAYEELKKRIERELTEPDLNAVYKNFLEGEQQRIAPLLAAAQNGSALNSRFMWIELTNKECSSLRPASNDARRVAVWAWSENVERVSHRDRADLERELAQASIDVQLKPPDLSKELPPRPESEATWFARLAIARYTLASGIDFQGSAGAYLRAGNGQAVGAAEIAPLIEKMMGGSLESLLADLDPAARAIAKSNSQGDWFRSVVPEAESQRKREFRITRLDQDPNGQAATVETALVVKLPQTGWRIVWSSKQTKHASDITPAAQEQIANDPQVKTALGLMSALGVSAEAEITKAIRFGAATMAAQKSADSDFLHFRDRYLDRLDGPPMY